MRDITNDADILDSRDIIERIEDLRRDVSFGDELDEDEAAELEALEELAEQAEGYGDWRYGAILIHEAYFTEYAKQLADDLGLTSESNWPTNHIDWDAAAEQLQTDYTEVDYDGVTYYMRA